MIFCENLEIIFRTAEDFPTRRVGAEEEGNMETMQLTHEQVMEIIPHRDPMLLIDEASEYVPGDHIVATFYVDPARDIFKGHFPGDPVLPGVYSVESCAQASDLVLMRKAEYIGKTPLFLGINNVRFRKKIVPGDTMEIHAHLAAERPEKAIATCKCEAYTAGDLAVECEVTIAMR